MKRNVPALFVAALALAGCAMTPTTLGWTRDGRGTPYPATDPANVRILEHKPDGAELLGQVHGVQRDGSPFDAAKIRAAELGADVIVVLAIGDEESENPFDPFPLQFVEANAWRTRK